MPLLSVLIATYNRPVLLKKAIDSVLMQTYSDFEIIVSDDCSDEETVNLMTELSDKDSRIKYFRNDKNLGPVGNSKKMCMKYPTGKYSLFLCDDDYFINKKYFEDVAKAVENNSDIGMIVGETRIIDEFDNSYQDVRLHDYGIFVGKDYFKTHKNIVPNFSSSFIDTKTLQKIYADVSDSNWEAGLEIMLLAYYLLKVVHINNLAVVWLYHSGGTGNYVAKKSPKVFIRAVDCYWKLFKYIKNDSSYSEDELAFIEHSYLVVPLKDFLCNLFRDGINSKDESVALFAERDAELGDYVSKLFSARKSISYDPNKSFVIFGAGVAGKEAAIYLKIAKMDIEFFVDDYAEGLISDIPVVKKDSVDWSKYNSLIALGDNDIAEKISEELKGLGAESILTFDNYIFSFFI